MPRGGKMSPSHARVLHFRRTQNCRGRTHRFAVWVPGSDGKRGHS